MTSTVFISHSCKDNEAPPANGAEPAARQRYERLTFARALRRALETRLGALDGVEVFLDQRDLRGGDLWEDGLHQALRTCDGAVVLLSPEALESDWVLKEVTILSWRVFLGERIVLVPVVLGVSDEALKTRGFGPLGLSRIQWVRVEGADQLDSAVTEVVDVLRSRLREDRRLDAAEKSDTERWILEFERWLRRAVPADPPALETDCLVKMCGALGIPSDERARRRFGEKPFENLACHALLASDRQIVKLLAQVQNTTEASERRELGRAVAALWVDPTPACRIPWAASNDKLVALDAKQPESARAYLRRAYCNQLGDALILMPNSSTDGTREAAIAEIESCLGERYPTDPDELADELGDERIFMILGPLLALPEVLAEMKPKYPQITFVVAAGEHPDRVLGSWFERDDVLLLEPPLQPTREQRATRFRNKLRDFVETS